MLSQSLFLLAAFAGTPGAEPNNGPLNANELQILPFAIERSQTHDFAPDSPIDGHPDEDWLIVEPIPGNYVFNVTELAQSPAGPLTLNARLYDATILTDSNAPPIAEYNDCATAPEGANVLDNFLSLPEPSYLLYVRVVECNGRTGGSYKIGFQPFEFTSPAQPVRISGTVTDQATMNAVGGVFLVDSTNSATFSDGAGTFSLVTLADTQVTINVFSEQWQAVGAVVIPPQPESTSVTGVSVQVAPVSLDLAIADAAADEAQAESGLDFVVSLTGGTLTDPFVVNYSTATGSADGNDFVAASGSLIFGGGNPASQTITVFGVDDAVVELDESFSVNLALPAPPALVNLADATATGTLRNDDTASLAVVASATAPEGSALQFSVKLAQATPLPFSVPFATADGSAVAPGDYTAITAGQLDFSGTAGEAQIITINTADDSAVELDETLTVTLGAPSLGSVLLDNATATGTILNDDTTSVAIVASAVANEGEVLQFAVTLDQAAPQPFSVPFATANGSATAPGDFSAISAGQLDFAGTAGEVQTITVSTGADSVVELDETLTVSLGTPSLAAVLLGNATATGTIVDDDTTTVAIVASVIADEGTALQFNVTLDQAVPQPFTVPFATANGSAVAPGDYTAISAGQLAFSGTPGEVQTITVTTVDDTDVEPDETIFVSLGTPDFASVLLGNATATGTIRNDDAETTSDADLAVTKTDGLLVTPADAPWTYTIVVTNLGPDDAFGALVSDVLPGELIGATWACTGSGGATCPASGSDDIRALVDLPADGTVTFILDATLVDGLLGPVTNTATVSPPAGVIDPVPANNSATDITATIDIFASGFESLTAQPGQWRYNDENQIWIQTWPGAGPGQAARHRVAYRGSDRLWFFTPWESDAKH